MATATERSKTQKLRTIIARAEGFEQRIMADLRTAGFEFSSVGEAARHLRARETVANLTQTEIANLLVASETKRK